MLISWASHERSGRDQAAKRKSRSPETYPDFHSRALSKFAFCTLTPDSGVLQNGTRVSQTNSGTTEKRRGRPKGATGIPKAGKRGKRGAVKELILAALKEAGETAMAVKNLVARIGIKSQNVHVWFATTGKKSGLTEGLGNGVYRLKQSAGVASPQEIPQAPKPKVTSKARRKPKPKKRKS